MNVIESFLSFTATILGVFTATASIFRNDEGTAVAWTAPVLGGKPVITFDQVDDLVLDIARGNGWTLVQGRDVQEGDSILMIGWGEVVYVNTIDVTYTRGSAVTADVVKRVGLDLDLDSPVLVSAARYR
jgi:hypothetical protein